MNFFFNSQQSIAPLLKGFVDIHSHILPGLDDGSKDMQDTKNMLQAYHEMGVKKIIATPHILKGSYPNRKETILPAFERVASELKELNIITNAAAEHMLDEDFEQMLKEGKLLPLKDHYMLVEMSYFQKPVNLKEIIFNMEHKGYTPVLAHPERYNFIKTIEEYRDLKKIGCLFQLNLLSLSKHYDPKVQKKADLLLKNDLYNFTGTDAHHEEHLKKLKEIYITNKKFLKLTHIIENTVEIFS